MNTQADVQRITNIQNFFSKLDLIEYFVAVGDDGFPITFYGISADEADALSALAVDLYFVSSETLKDVFKRKKLTSREVLVVLNDESVINVARANSLILAVKGHRRLVGDAMQIALDYLEGNNTIRCPYCTTDLTLETYKCNNCSKIIPFRSASCPHCGYPTRIKRCPYCGRYTTNDGRRVKLGKPKDAKSLVLLEGATGALVSGTIIYSISDTVTGALIAGLLGGAIFGYVIYRSMKPEYQIE